MNDLLQKLIFSESASLGGGWHYLAGWATSAAGPVWACRVCRLRKVIAGSDERVPPLVRSDPWYRSTN